MKELCQIAVDAAKRLGAVYADARIVELRNQRIVTEDERVAALHDQESCGIGVRVIADGAWGFTASADLTRNGIEKAVKQAVTIARAGSLAKAPGGIHWADEPAHVDTYRTPVEVDPFAVPLEEKIALLLAMNKEMLGVKGVNKALSFMHFRRQHRFIANTDGSLIETDVVTSLAWQRATAVGNDTAKYRTCELSPRNAGYEIVRDGDLVREAHRVGSQAVEHLHARLSPTGRKDLILLPPHLMLTMHESIGHATELDRVLGMEESLAGSSFATLDQLGKLKYGSPLMNIVCDNTYPIGLASMGYDDDGVKCQRWDLIRNGILVDYQTNRETAHATGAKRSHGSCRAESWSHIPITRQSNFSLEPGEEPLSLDELIGDTKDGILIDGEGSYSIDQKRVNFQFGGDCFWEIKNGKVTGMLRDVTYQAITTEFWGALDALCDKRFWEPRGAMYCGKGDPAQSAQMTHASVPARFRQIQVTRAKE
jgi:TldD protein